MTCVELSKYERNISFYIYNIFYIIINQVLKLKYLYFLILSNYYLIILFTFTLIYCIYTITLCIPFNVFSRCVALKKADF